MEKVLTQTETKRKKVSKKELLKIKKIEKQKRKQELEQIVQKHAKECMVFLDDAYSEVMQNLEDANNQLLEMSNYLVQEKKNLQKAIKEDDLELVEELAEDSALITDQFIKQFARIIVPSKTNSIASPLAKASELSYNYLNNLIDELERKGHKNAVYVSQLVLNQIKTRASEYADLTCKDFYADNPYMEMFSEALQDYISFLESLDSFAFNDSFEIQEIEVDDKKLKKVVSNSRLRCTHTDMMNFARAMGYEENRQANTTHRIWKNKETGISLPIPAKGNRTLPQGTMSRMLKQMNLTRMDLANFLGK